MTAAGEPDERLSYEQARAELAQVVERLEAGGTSLEESLALWETGRAARRHLPRLPRRRPGPDRRRPADRQSEGAAESPAEGSAGPQ